MKFQLFLVILISILFFQCKYTGSKSPAGDLKYSANYKAPVFTDSNRLEKVKAVIPEIDSVFRQFASDNHFPGFAYGIVMDGSLIHSGALGTINLSTRDTVTRRSQFRIASMTKSFTTLAIMRLRDEGKLSLTEPVATYLPELASLVYLTKDASPVNIQHLMTMMPGLPEDNPWADRQLEDTDEEFLAFLKAGLSLSNNPGTEYEYSNLGFAMLGTIITRAAGMPYQRYINEKILQPLGMTHTYWDFSVIPASELALGYRWEDEQWKLEPMLRDGAYGCIGGLITSIEDFSKYVAFHLSVYPPGNGVETGPVKRSSVREMHQFFGPRLMPNATNSDGTPCPGMAGYGFGFRLQKDCNGVLQVGHSGGLPGFGSNYLFLPEYGIGIMGFSNRTYSPVGSAINQVKEILIKKAGIQSRELPVSNILAQRKEQVVQLIQNWDEKLGEEILAENFYLDKSRGHRMKEARDVLAALGNIVSVDPLQPLNQLRGWFHIIGEKGKAEVFFTLSPEKVPKLQALNLDLLPNEQ